MKQRLLSLILMMTAIMMPMKLWAEDSVMYGSWTYTEYNENGDSTNCYVIVLNQDNTVTFPEGVTSESATWNYDGSTLTISQIVFSTSDHVTQAGYTATPDSESNPMHFTGTKHTERYNNGFNYDGGTVSFTLDRVGNNNVSSEVTWTVAGVAALCGTTWDQTDTSNDMTTEDGIVYKWTKTEVPLEHNISYYFKIARDHTWDEAYPSENYTFSVDEPGLYTVEITFNSSTHEISLATTRTGDYTFSDKTWTIAGVTSLCGSEWDPADTSNDMTAMGNGMFQLVKENLTLEANVSYEYKVVANHSWDENYGGGVADGPNQVFTVDADGVYNVTFMFNAETKELTATVALADGITGEPYAVLNEDNTVLTFYYDDQKTARNGMSVGPFTQDGGDWASNSSTITTAVFDASFANCTTLTSTAYWFSQCQHLTTIEGIENLKTNHVTDMENMFWNCPALTELDVTRFNTQNVTNMSGMFAFCSALTRLDVGGFNTANVTDMSYMFYQCKNVPELNVSPFKTEQVTNMSYMFYECSALTALDVSGFSTNNVTNIEYMFSDCTNLQMLDLSNFNTANVTQMRAMFRDCSQLALIYAGRGWTTEGIVNNTGNNMFLNCTNLVGGNGTTYDANNVGYTYARIDREGEPGYFTEKNTTSGETWTVAGVKALCGTAWDPSDTSNDMTTEDGTVYRWVKNDVPLKYGTYEFKVARDHAWDVSYPDQNYSFSIVESGNYTVEITFNTATYEINAIATRTGEYTGPDTTTWTVAGVSDLCGTSWDETDTSNDMTTEDNVVYKWTKNEVPLNYNTAYQFKIVRDHDWDTGSYPVDEYTIYVDEPGLYTVEITFNVSSGEITVSTTRTGDYTFTDRIWTIAGVTAICGSEWDPSDTSNDMTAMGNGIFQLVKKNLTLEADVIYEYKVAANHSWEENYGDGKAAGPNQYFSVGADGVYDVTFTFNESTKELTASVALAGEMVVEPYAVLADNTDVVSTDAETGEVTYGKTLTFYYDNQKAARNGMSVGPFTDTDEKGWDSARHVITTVKIDSTFANCTSITSTAHWFRGCESLTSISGLNYLNTSNVISMEAMFMDCRALSSLNMSNVNTSNVKNMAHMFAWCLGLESVSGLNTENVLDMRGMFAFCGKLKYLDTNSFNTSNVTNMSSMFLGAGSGGLDLSKFNTTNVTNMYGMFYEAGLTNLDLSSFNTTNVTDMRDMFYNCSNLKTLDVSHFNTENVTDMSGMFALCSSLTSLDLSSFNTINVKNMGRSAIVELGMFSGCSNLTTLDISNFNTENTESMNYMFAGCSSLTSLDVRSFNTVNTTAMECMFGGCSNLKELDLSSFNTANVKNMWSMFLEDSLLTTILVGDGWSTELVETGDSLFMGCPLLKGGMGTTYDANHVDHAYARIDGGAAAPGYFTPKNGYPTVAALEFSHVNNNVYIHTETENATIYYTLNGETPDATSNVYQDSILVRRNGIIKAIAMKDYYLPSEVATFTVDWFEVPPVDIVYDGRYFSIEADATAQVNYSINGGNAVPYTGGKIEVPGLCTVHVTAEVEGMNTAEADFSVNSYFDGKTAQVRDGGSFSEAFQWCGTNAALNDITAIMWNKSTALSYSEMQGIENPNLLLYVSNKALAPGNVKNIVVGDSLSGYKAQQIVLTDTETGNGNFYCPIPFTASRITYEREFLQYTEPDSCRGWETLVLPFAPQSIMHERNGVLRPFAAEGEGRPFWLREFNSNGFVDAKQIEANKPYVIAMPNHVAYDMEYRLGGWVTFSAYGCNVPQTNLQTATDSTGTIRFIPALSTEMQQDSVYALNVGEEYLVNNMKYAEGSIFVAGWSDVRPFHCYTQHVANSPAPRFMPLAGWSMGDATGISEELRVKSEEFATAPVYNLKGQRVMQPTKGIYIVNGKKVKK